MTLLELFIIAVGLSMDAFAVSVCKGLSLQKMRLRHALLAGIYFGGFQAAMPFFGYLLGVKFQDAITSIDHWVAFILLAIIGVNMVKEALSKEEEEETTTCYVPRIFWKINGERKMGLKAWKKVVSHKLCPGQNCLSVMKEKLRHFQKEKSKGADCWYQRPPRVLCVEMDVTRQSLERRRNTNSSCLGKHYF